MKTLAAKTANSLEELVEFISQSNPDPNHPGPTPVTIIFGDGREITGSYSDEDPHAISEFDIFVDKSPLIPLTRKLLGEGTPFVTQTGEDDMVCILEWRIE